MVQTLLLFSATVLTLVACGTPGPVDPGTNDAAPTPDRPMTVGEYASWCAEREARADPATWGEWLERYQADIDRWEVMQPLWI